MSAAKIVVVVLILLLVLFVVYQLARTKKKGRQKTSAIRPAVLNSGSHEFIVLYTFDAGPYPEHLHMLEASIISVLRELGSKVLILVYTTTKPQLSYLKARYNGYKGAELKVKTYSPRTNPKHTFEGGLSVFDKIGHSRIFLIHKLLQWYEKPVIYMDNDTLITDGKGALVSSQCYDGHVYGYLEESWVTFASLYAQFKYTCVFDPSDTYYTNCLKISPINNGVEIYPYNDSAIEFAKDVIDTYCTLEATCKSHFHDMLAFSMVWYKYPGSKCLASAAYDSGGSTYGKGTGTFATNTTIPSIIHYYLGKYEHLEYIDSVTKLLAERFAACGALYLIPADVNGTLLIDQGLICHSCPPGTVPVCPVVDDLVAPICGPGAVPDCAGICSGPSVKDCAGTCYNPLIDDPPNLIDCGGQCYQDGTTPPHTPDCAGACYAHGQPPLHAPDCHGVCDGTATFDCAGVCGGMSYQDCGGNCINPVCDL